MTPVIVRNVALGEGKPKICIPIMGKTEDQIAEAANEITNLPADLVEWRADDCPDIHEEMIVRILTMLRTLLGAAVPILFTIRTKKEGGQFLYSAENYIRYNKAALEGEADLIDVELSAGKSTTGILLKEAHRKRKKVILSSHDFSKTPDEQEMLQRLCRMQERGADISKLAVMPRSASDVLNLLSVSAAMKTTYADRPFITMSMGQDGLISRLAGETFGSCLTFGCGTKASAPGQMKAEALSQVLEAIHTSLNPFAGHTLSRHIFLIGFMGTGKSTIARILSRRLAVKQIEMDQQIVDNEGMEINEIFSRYGEEYFRDLETKTLRELTGEKPAVISCGGGIVLREENIRLMQEMGKVILLTAKPETILSRVKRDNSRPNLKGRKTVEGIQELMSRREAFYQSAAQILIGTDNQSPDEVAEAIVKSL